MTILKATASAVMPIEREAERVLRSDYGNPTEWIVFSGPPASGKTSTLQALAAEGVPFVEDASRSHIEHAMESTGLSSEEIRADVHGLQRAIFLKMLAATQSADRLRTTVFDYALPDNIAFLEMEGVPVSAEVWRSAILFRFKAVFLFCPLANEYDGVRTESDAYREALMERLGRVYMALGYRPIKVPVATIDQRVAFVKRRLLGLNSRRHFNSSDFRSLRMPSRFRR